VPSVIHNGRDTKHVRIQLAHLFNYANCAESFSRSKEIAEFFIKAPHVPVGDDIQIFARGVRNFIGSCQPINNPLGVPDAIQDGPPRKAPELTTMRRARDMEVSSGLNTLIVVKVVLSGIEFPDLPSSTKTRITRPVRLLPLVIDTGIPAGQLGDDRFHGVIVNDSSQFLE